MSPSESGSVPAPESPASESGAVSESPAPQSGAASPSEFGELCRRVRESSEELLRTGGVADVPAEDLRALVSAATRLYATANEGAAEATDPLEGGVSTTEAVVLVTALLKAQDLNPFDLALWFSRSRTAG
ncbi:hypothetical protein [Bounagaea algeriensis]